MANTMRSKNPPEKKTSVVMVPKGPPDGGWGWLVVFGSFMIHVVTDGVTYSFGVLYAEFLKVFQESKGATAWIASLLVGITLCSGPIASIFVNKYGCRLVTIFGAILAGVCLLISGIAANSVITLYLTIGLGTGLGFGMIYLPAIVSVTCYFEKYRSLATGIAVCGSGLGTFIFSPLVDFLITHFGWRITIVVIAGLVFVCTLFGMLFRPLAMEEQQVPGDNASTIILNIVEPPASTEREPLNGDVANGHGRGGGDGAGAAAGSQSCEHLPNSDDDADDEWKRHRRAKKSSQSQRNQLLPTQVTVGNELDKQSRFTISQPELVAATSDAAGRPLDNRQRNQTYYASQNLNAPMANGSGIMYKKDIFYSGSMVNLNQHRRRTISQMTNNSGFTTEISNAKENDKFSDNICCSADAKNTIKHLLDFGLLKDPVFILYTISNFLTSIGFNIPYLFLVAQATDLNIPSNHSSYLLALLGIANTLGRIVLGFISDKPWINRLLVYNMCLTICGISTILSVFCTGIFTLSMYTITFGATIGAYVGLTSVILVDLLGLDKLTNAFGILLLFQGIASLIGPPIAGWLYDVSKSYNPAFYLSGLTITFSGLMLFIIPYVQRRCERQEHEKMTAIVNN